MTPDARTLAFYAEAAERYAAKLGAMDGSPELAAFIDRLPDRARVLDLGCGPGNASAAMAAAGHDPDPVDASPAMLRIARETHGLPAREATFDADFGTATYDGIWASYSLLHAPRADISRHIVALARALRPGGPLFLGLKIGTGERRDNLGRLYSYVSADELHGWVTGTGLMIADSRQTQRKGCAGTEDPCIDLLAVKPGHG